MKQWITIAKLAGKSGEAVASVFRKFCDSNSAAAPKHRSDVYSGLVTQCLTSLRLPEAAPPVLFFCQYLDMWSMGDMFEIVFGPKTTPNISSSLTAGSATLICYSLPDSNALLTTLAAKGKRNKRHTIPSEVLWFHFLLRESVLAWSALSPVSTIVVVREIIGASVSDPEIEAANSTTPDWLVRLKAVNS